MNEMLKELQTDGAAVTVAAAALRSVGVHPNSGASQPPPPPPLQPVYMLRSRIGKLLGVPAILVASIDLYQNQGEEGEGEEVPA